MEVDSGAGATGEAAAGAAAVATAAEQEEEEEPSDELKAALAMSMQAEGAGVEGAAGPGLPGNFKGTYELFAVVTHKGREADGGTRDGTRAKKQELVVVVSCLSRTGIIFGMSRYALFELLCFFFFL